VKGGLLGKQRTGESYVDEERTIGQVEWIPTRDEGITQSRRREQERNRKGLLFAGEGKGDR